MTRIRVLLLVLCAAFCLPQVALANTTVATVSLSGTVAAGSHTYDLQVRDSDGLTTIGTKSSGPHAGGTTADTVAASLGGAYDSFLTGTVASANVTLTDTASRLFRSFVQVDGGGYTEITVGAPVLVGGITFATAAAPQFTTPALSTQGLLIFLLLASGAFFVLRRKRSGRMAV
jgi:hypothetical protein